VEVEVLLLLLEVLLLEVLLLLLLVRLWLLVLLFFRKEEENLLEIDEKKGDDEDSRGELHPLGFCKAAAVVVGVVAFVLAGVGVGVVVVNVVDVDVAAVAAAAESNTILHSSSYSSGMLAEGQRTELSTGSIRTTRKSSCEIRECMCLIASHFSVDKPFCSLEIDA